ncbi:MAG: hypothetical protein QM750_12825 [Rubrivivax sp.]
MYNLLRSTSLAALALAAAGPARADVPLPVAELTVAQQAALSGMSYLSPANQAFRMAAAVKVSAYNKGSPVQAVQRKSADSAAVYAGLPATVSPPLLPTLPAGSSLLDFIGIGDHAQAWATMTAEGVPHLWARGYGQFTVDATASWTTALTVPAGGSRELVLRFVIPPATVSGDTEQQSIARWRSRLRADVLVNGFPAWSTEAMRLTLDPKVQGNSLAQTLVLQQFGSPLAFVTDDEDASAANDSNAGSVNTASAKRTVHLSLGRFNAGTVVDLAMVLRGSALTAPELTGGTDHRCDYVSAQARWFCSRGSLSVTGVAGDAPRIYLLP